MNIYFRCVIIIVRYITQLDSQLDLAIQPFSENSKQLIERLDLNINAVATRLNLTL